MPIVQCVRIIYTVICQRYKQTWEDALVWKGACFITKKKSIQFPPQIHDVKFYNQGL